MLSRAFKVKYLLLVAITVFVIFGNLVFMQSVQHHKMDNARIINLLGKEQLILSKIGNLRMSDDEDSIKRNHILLEFSKIEKINDGLIDGDKELDLHDMENLKLKNKMLKLRDSLVVLKSKVSQSTYNGLSFSDLHILIGTCLERIADDFFQDTQSKYIFIYRLQIALALLTVLAFLIVIFFNYMPLEKKLQDSINELEKQDDNLRSLINSTKESIYFLSKKGKVFYFNKLGKESLLERTGLELREGDDFEQFLFIGMEDRFQDCFQKALSLQISEMEWQIVLEGKLIWYYFGFFPVINEKSEVLGVSFIASNIQEKKLAALKNEAYVAELEKIAWKQSHLLRAPVANIIGLSKLLLRNPERQISAETKHLLNMIATETLKMDQEIHKIVQYSNSLSSKIDIF